ncbi:MAG TPA: glycine cleavage system protein GcvH [Planctomycetota bacterium]|nr:glycine cleavage system protein GcvH [Planctomycetota bacterium]
MNPKDLKYTESHEWARIEGDVATIGITEHAAQALSDLVYLGLPAVGAKLTAGRSFGEIESVKAVSDLNSPVDGEVIEVNGDLPDNLGTINSDPYGGGWMVKVRLKGKPSGKLLDAAAYDKHAAEAH